VLERQQFQFNQGGGYEKTNAHSEHGTAPEVGA
jgi:hypothetical protein